MDPADDWPAQPLAGPLVAHVLHATERICEQMQGPAPGPNEAGERSWEDRSLVLGWALGMAGAAMGHDLLFERRNRNGLESMHGLVGELVPLAPTALPQLHGEWTRWEMCWIVSSLWYLAARGASGEFRFRMDAREAPVQSGHGHGGYTLRFETECRSHSRLWIERLQRQCPAIQLILGPDQFELYVPAPPKLFKLFKRETGSESAGSLGI